MNNDRKEVGIEHMFHVLSSPRWITLMFVLPLLAVAHFALAQTTDSGTVKFDHVQTGFNLTGSHAQARCGSCHIEGVFKGTPRDCATCHITGNRMGADAKPFTHISTFAKCDSCHKTTVWTDGSVPGVMNHMGIIGDCASCHNGQAFAGVTPKSKTAFPSHIVTSADCSICHHSTVTFLTSMSGAMPTNHVPTSQPCLTCHASFDVNSGVMSHTGILSGCASCHNGQAFYGVTPVSKPVNHLPTSAACETCHSATKFTSFSGTAMIHTGILSGCASCHNGQAFAGVTPVSKPVNHMPTTAACETCHSASKFTAFSGTAMIHTSIVSGCASCHNGQVFAGVTPVSKPTNHLPTSAACETCHSASKFTTFSGTSMSHTGILNNCTQCHNGQVFAGVTPVSKTAFPSHVATSADCSTCHTSTVSFVTSSTTMPANHLPTAQPCATCHTSFAVNSGVMSHTGILSGCASCHNGQAFYGVTPVSKPVNHLPTSAACETCHSATKFTAFSGTAMIHTGILSGCASCHNGQAFAGVTPVSKPVNHLPTTAACETCHSASKFTSFSGTTMNHTGILSGCASCHNGQVFAGVTPVSKTSFPSHQVTTADCSTCHTSTVTFVTSSGGTMPANHLPTAQPCTTCHTSFGANSGVMNHTGILSGCASCHNGQSFFGVTPVSKPSNHIPYATALLGGANMGCEFCHTPTVFTSFTSLVSSTTMHNGSQGGGSSGLCVTCHLSGTNYLGSMQKTSHNGASASKDCSSSGCHRPLGSKGSSYTQWD